MRHFEIDIGNNRLRARRQEQQRVRRSNTIFFWFTLLFSLLTGAMFLIFKTRPQALDTPTVTPLDPCTVFGGTQSQTLCPIMSQQRIMHLIQEGEAKTDAYTVADECCGSKPIPNDACCSGPWLNYANATYWKFISETGTELSFILMLGNIVGENKDIAEYRAKDLVLYSLPEIDFNPNGLACETSKLEKKTLYCSYWPVTTFPKNNPSARPLLRDYESIHLLAIREEKDNNKNIKEQLRLLA